jgi:uncharacterized membrane protein
MAGIGFELRKLVETRTLRGVLGAAFSGTLVVAGPWLVSAASVAAAQRLPFFTGPGVALEFTGAMVWAFALSICLSAAPLYIFVRLTSDLIYENRKGEAASLLLKFAAATALASLPLGGAAAFVLCGGGAGAGLLRLAFVLLFAAANVLWAAMMTASVVRRHWRIILAYATGMGLMYLLSRELGPRLGAGGAMLALAAGYAFTALALLAATVDALGLTASPRAFHRLAAYARRYRNLALAGSLYAAATWIDKAVLALGDPGSAAEGTRFFITPSYDGAFYYANLALIPGLVFFTISTETEFYLALRRFIGRLGGRRLPDIEEAKKELIRGPAGLLARQTGFQAIVAASLALLAPLLSPLLGIEAPVFIRLLAATLFQLVFLSGLNLLFYLELYRDAALCAGILAGLNLVLSLAALASGNALDLAGLPYLGACATSALLVILAGRRGLSRFDRIIFLRASGQDYGI